jgi:hypothetical protein
VVSQLLDPVSQFPKPFFRNHQHSLSPAAC